MGFGLPSCLMKNEWKIGGWGIEARRSSSMVILYYEESEHEKSSTSRMSFVKRWATFHEGRELDSRDPYDEKTYQWAGIINEFKA